MRNSIPNGLTTRTFFYALSWDIENYFKSDYSPKYFHVVIIYFVLPSVMHNPTHTVTSLWLEESSLCMCVCLSVRPFSQRSYVARPPNLVRGPDWVREDQVRMRGWCDASIPGQMGSNPYNLLYGSET